MRPVLPRACKRREDEWVNGERVASVYNPNFGQRHRLSRSRRSEGGRITASIIRPVTPRNNNRCPPTNLCPRKRTSHLRGLVERYKNVEERFRRLQRIFGVWKDTSDTESCCEDDGEGEEEMPIPSPPRLRRRSRSVPAKINYYYSSSSEDELDVVPLKIDDDASDECIPDTPASPPPEPEEEDRGLTSEEDVFIDNATKKVRKEGSRRCIMLLIQVLLLTFTVVYLLEITGDGRRR